MLRVRAQADMEKAAIAQRAQQAAEAIEAAQRAREAAAAAERAAYEQGIEDKRAGLPAEPPPGAEGAVTVMVRLPDGRRASRRSA